MRFEIAFQAYDKPGPLQAKEGDIIVARPAIGRIGNKEKQQFIWLTVDVPPAVVQGLSELPVNPDGSPAGVKRRFRVNVAQIKTLMPSFDETRMRNKLEAYQPLLSVNGNVMTSTEDVPVTNLFQDKGI